MFFAPSSSREAAVPLQYRRHFLLLAAALILIVILSRLNLFSEPFLPSFAIYGALHAAAVAAALRAPQSWQKKFAFIGLAAALNVATLYIGIVELDVLKVMPSTLRLYLTLGTCALWGAVSYGFLIRFFWRPDLSPRPIIQIALGCAAACLVALLIESTTVLLGSWWLAAVWWLAFSGGLWARDRRSHTLRPHTDT